MQQPQAEIARRGRLPEGTGGVDVKAQAARQFSAFYRDCKVVGAAEDGEDEVFRIALCVQAKRELARSLDLLGVSAPEEM